MNGIFEPNAVRGFAAACLAAFLAVVAVRLDIDGDLPGAPGWLAVAWGLSVVALAVVGAALHSRIDSVRRIVALSMWPALTLWLAARIAVEGDGPDGPAEALAATAALVAGACLCALAADGGLLVGAALRERRAPRRRAIATVGVALVLALGGWSGVLASRLDLRAFDSPPLTPYGRALAFLGRLRDAFPYWGDDGREFRPWIDGHRDELREAASSCAEDSVACSALIDVVRVMLGDLRSGHLDVVDPEAVTAPAVDLRCSGDDVVVAWAGEGTGLRAGDAVVSVDGRPAGEALRSVPSWLANATSARTRRIEACSRMLYGPGGSVRLGVRAGSGSLRTAVVERPALDVAEPAPSAPGVHADGEEVDVEDDGDGAVDVDDTDDGVRTLTVYDFEGEGFEGLLDDALSAKPPPRGVVVDLRGCPGGVVDYATDLVSRFVPEKTRLGSFCEPVRGSRDHCWAVETRKPDVRFDGPVAVLIDPFSRSASELAADALCNSGRARCFGEPTGGETDLAETWWFEDGQVLVPVGRYLPASGARLRGNGVRPQETVEPGLGDDDPPYDAAVAWIRGEVHSAP